MIEKYFIEYCSPTLASIKIGNLFNISRELNEDLYKFEKEQKDFFDKKGLKMFILRQDEKTLIYLCRITKSTNDLFRTDIKRYLESIGYKYNNLDEAVECLKIRINETSEFPHEIGLFLGYPLEDVLGFIENKGRNYKACGHWKVYNDESYSTNMFYRFNKCKNVYLKLWSQGRDIYKLTVTA